MTRRFSQRAGSTAPSRGRTSPGAPPTTHPCVCADPLTITTGDGIRRCISCAGTVEQQPQLPTEWRTA